MASTLANAAAVLKEDYLGPVTEQLNQSFFLLTQVEKNSEAVEGKRAYHPVHVTRSSGVGARSEGGTLPTASQQGYTNTLVPIRSNYGRIQLSGQVIEAMKSDKGSFFRAVKDEMDGITKDLKRDVNRQLWGTSNGVIATCGTTTTASVVVLLTPTATQLRQLGSDGTAIVVDIGTVAAPTTIASARTVTAVDTTNGTITISGATVSTVSGTHFVFRSGSGGASANTGVENDGQHELTGLQTIVKATGILHSIDPTTYGIWVAGSYANGGTLRQVSESLVNQAIMEQEIISGMQVDLLIGSSGVARAAANQQTSIRRNIDNVALKAGYSGLEWSTPLEGLNPSFKKRALVYEKDCPARTLYGLSTESLVQYEMSDWAWMDQDGAVLSRVANSDAYEATLRKYHELACTQRNANVVISDLTEA